MDKNILKYKKYSVIEIDDISFSDLKKLLKPSKRGKARIMCNTCRRHHHLHWGEFQKGLKNSETKQGIIDYYSWKYCV